MRAFPTSRRVAYPATFLLASSSWIAGGCGGGVFTIEPGSGDDGAVPNPNNDAGSGCTPADCAGLAAPTDAKLCPGGASVGRSVCAKQADSRCGWEFAPCPAVDASGTCQCAGPAPGAPNVRCSDGSIGGPVCTTHSDGTCSWEVRSCPGPRCPGLGCNPMCPNGVLKDIGGCDTCQCAPAPDGGSITACKTNGDCAGGAVCGYREADGCAAMGSCFSAPGALCNAVGLGCACDGSKVNVICTGLPAGYASKPLLHPGLCTDGG
jgi:hypothetical protein